MTDQSGRKNIRPNAEQEERLKDAKMTMQNALGTPDFAYNEFVTRGAELAALLAEHDDPLADELLAEAFPEYRYAIDQQPTDA